MNADILGKNETILVDGNNFYIRRYFDNLRHIYLDKKMFDDSKREESLLLHPKIAISFSAVKMEFSRILLKSQIPDPQKKWIKISNSKKSGSAKKSDRKFMETSQLPINPDPQKIQKLMKTIRDKSQIPKNPDPLKISIKKFQ